MWTDSSRGRESLMESLVQAGSWAHCAASSRVTYGPSARVKQECSGEQEKVRNGSSLVLLESDGVIRRRLKVLN